MNEIRKLISSFSQIIERNVLKMKKEILIFNQTKIISRIVLQLNTLHMKKDISFLILYHIITMENSTYTGQESNIELPFGGFFKEVIAKRNGTWIDPRFSDKVNQWYKTQKQAQLMLCEDLDAIISACIYSTMTGFKINQFYNFETLYKQDLDNNDEVIGLDVALVKGKCIDNHVTRYSPYSFTKRNLEAINPNNYLKASGSRYYTSKFAMSTAIVLYSMLDLTLPKSDAGKMILLYIDQGFKGYYPYIDKNGNTRNYRKQYINNLEMLGLTGLIDVLKRYTDDDFKKLKKMIDNKQDKIFVNSQGELQTRGDMAKYYDFISRSLGYPIALPSGKWTKVQSFNKQLFDTKDDDPLKTKNIFSLVYTYSGRGVYSEIID